LQRPDALERAVDIQKLALQGLVQALDFPGGGRRVDLGEPVGNPVSRQIRSNNTSTGTPGLWNRPVNTLPLSVSTSSGTP
jgi:hypothetical protein